MGSNTVLFKTSAHIMPPRNDFDPRLTVSSICASCLRPRLFPFPPPEAEAGWNHPFGSPKHKNRGCVETPRMIHGFIFRKFHQKAGRHNGLKKQQTPHGADSLWCCNHVSLHRASHLGMIHVMIQRKVAGFLGSRVVFLSRITISITISSFHISILGGTSTQVQLIIASKLVNNFWQSNPVRLEQSITCSTGGLIKSWQRNHDILSKQ